MQLPLGICFLRVRCQCVQHAMAGPNKFRPASHQLSALDPRILTSGAIRTALSDAEHKESGPSRKPTGRKARNETMAARRVVGTRPLFFAAGVLFIDPYSAIAR